MKISIDNFQGMAPRISPRALPDSMSQDATNPRLLSGDLQAWRDWLSVFSLTKSGPINTIYLMQGTNAGDPVWLSWNDTELGDGAVCVDVARGPIPGDTNERTYLTGLDLPRFTTLTAAIDGSGTDYPYVTYLLGVPAVDGAPVAEVIISGDATDGSSLNFEDTGSNLSLYTTSQNVGSGSSADRFVGAANTLDGTKPASWYGLQSRLANRNAYMQWAMGITDITTLVWEADFQLVTAFGEDGRLELRLLNSSSGAGPAIRIDGKTDRAYVGVATTFGTDVDTSSTSFPVALSMATTYRFRIDVSTGANNIVTCQFRLAEQSTPTTYFVDQSFPITPVGSHFAFGTSETSTGGSRAFIAAYNNLTVSGAVQTGGDGSGAGTDTATTAATNYVQTWVNEFDEEGPPSLVSNTVVRSQGAVVQIYLITSADTGFPTDYNIVSTRLYRAVTGSSGTSYQLVAADLPVDYPTYTDTLSDAELGEVLLSDTWDLPPDDLRGIIALPNGIMAGFSKNQLCLSEPYRPHAWPVGYRLSVDTDIVGIGAIDANVVIFTNAYPYIASGTTPSDYTLSKLELPQGCVSKRSISYLRSVGVLYASPDGLCAVNAVGNILNLTERLFAREEWQELNPSSIIAAVHDDRYVGFYDTTSLQESNAIQQGFMLDLHTDGFGFEYLDIFATAVYSNPETDTLYINNYQAEAPGSQTFTYTGSSESFVVPNGYDELTIKIWGAGGGGGVGQDNAGEGSGGGGGFSEAVISVTPGETLTVIVGGGGSAGFGSRYGGGGGGGSAILRGATPLIVAGGGGGAPGFGGTSLDLPGGGGGAGGGTSGQGGASPQNGTQGAGGAGGNQSAPGAGGTYILGVDGDAGSGTTGGNGGNVGGTPPAAAFGYGNGGQSGLAPGDGGGGGGGGGYFGGGGGNAYGYGGGGGGGSGYVPGGGTTTSGDKSTPGNSADPDRGTAGNGGGLQTAGNPGLVIITWSQ